jgi:hypothetical protein
MMPPPRQLQLVLPRLRRVFRVAGLTCERQAPSLCPRLSPYASLKAQTQWVLASAAGLLCAAPRPNRAMVPAMLALVTLQVNARSFHRCAHATPIILALASELSSNSRVCDHQVWHYIYRV